MQKRTNSKDLKGISEGPVDFEGIEALRSLAEAVGQFIDYWGFRSVHGQIWCVLWLAKRPLCVIEISKVLNLSKALISPALVQLEDYGLMVQVGSMDSRKKFYQAVPDVMPTIQKILQQRERTMLDTAAIRAKRLQSTSPTILDQNRLDKLQSMVQSAKQGLELILMLNFLDPAATSHLSVKSHSN